MRLLLIRHGMTEGNMRRAYIGSTDEPLSQKGREAVAALHYPEADAVFSSPMARAKETAELIYPDKTAVIVEALRECSFGEFEGKTYDELRERPDYRAWIDAGGNGAAPGGEDSAAFRKRSADAVLKIAQTAKCGSTVAVICHGGTIMAYMHRRFGGGFYDWQVENAHGYMIDGEGRYEPI